MSDNEAFNPGKNIWALHITMRCIMKLSKIVSIFIFTSFLAISCSSSDGGNGGDGNTDLGAQEPASTEINALDNYDRAQQVGQYNWSYAIREKIPTTYPDEMETLLSAESSSEEMLIEKFKEEATFGRDTSLCIFAYIIEQNGYQNAVPTLINWLETNIFNDTHRSADFVTHALKVLTAQDDLDTVYYSYGFQEILDTVDKARASQTSARSEFGYHPDSFNRRSAAETGSPARCKATFEITGRHQNGQNFSTYIDGNIWLNDFNDLGAQGEVFKAAQIKLDNQWYGDENDPDRYETISDSVSRRQDCAGLVAQQVFGVEETFASEDPKGILDASLAFGEEVGDVTRLSDVVGKNHVGLWQNRDNSGTVSHVFYIEERADGAYIVSKDAHGYIRQKKMAFEMVGNKKVYLYPFSKMTDKQQLHYPEARLRIFKIDKTRIFGSAALVECASAGNCPDGGVMEFADSMPYAKCTATTNAATKKYYLFKTSGTGYRMMWGGWADKMTGYDYSYQYILPSEAQSVKDQLSQFDEFTANNCERGPAICPCPPYPDIWESGSVDVVGAFDTLEELDAYRCDNPHNAGSTLICNMWDQESAQGSQFWDPINSICNK
ncbi:MAG: hypothetical protein C4522_13855 [Desulfobacteraceae bacterium]|nr:MAG: hypothetical protein C4522_13855 [Desulfobacteraceae bacterium]